MKKATHAPRYSARIIEQLAKLGPVEVEHRFHPVRKWRFDYAWPKYGIALEVDGGLWVNGGHSRGSGRRKDMEKGNHACAMGWLVFRTDPDNVYSHNLYELIRQASIGRDK